MSEAGWIVSLPPILLSPSGTFSLTSDHLLAEVGPGLGLLVRLEKTKKESRAQKGRVSPQFHPPQPPLVRKCPRPSRTIPNLLPHSNTPQCPCQCRGEGTQTMPIVFSFILWSRRKEPSQEILHPSKSHFLDRLARTIKNRGKERVWDMVAPESF